MLQNAGPVRDDGTDRFFGLENVRRALPDTPGAQIFLRFKLNSLLLPEID